MPPQSNIKIAVEALTRNGLGSVNHAGFYRNRFPCPKHGGKGNNAVLHERGFIYCHSRCYTIHIPEVLDLLGIQGDWTDADRRAWNETRQEQAAQADAALRETMARNQIEAAVADTYSHLPIETYDMMFDAEVAVLMEAWRAGNLQIDFGEKPQDPPPIAELPPRDLTANQFRLLCHVMTETKVALTAYCLRWAADGDLDAEITYGQISANANAAGLMISKSAIYDWLDSAPCLTKIGDRRYTLVDNETFEMRLTALETNQHIKDFYSRAPAYFQFAESDLPDAIIDTMEAHRDAYPVDSDLPPAPFSPDLPDGIIEMLEAHRDAENEAPFSSDYDRAQELIELPDVMPAIAAPTPKNPDRLRTSIFAWWLCRNIQENETITRRGIFERTGLNEYEQRAYWKLSGGCKKLNKETVKLTRDDLDRIKAAPDKRDKACLSFAVSKSSFAKGEAVARRIYDSDTYVVQGGNTYGHAGGEIETLLNDRILQGVVDEKNIGCKKQSSADDKPRRKPPKLPPARKDAPYTDESVLIHALWNELDDLKWLDKADFAGKEVTMDDLIAIVRRGAPAPKSGWQPLEGTDIPF